MGASASRLQSPNGMNENSFAKTAAKLGVCFFCGGIFGVATEKGKGNNDYCRLKLPTNKIA